MPIATRQPPQADEPRVRKEVEMQRELVGFFLGHRFVGLDPKGISRRRVQDLKDGLACFDLEEKVADHIHIALQGFDHFGSGQPLTHMIPGRNKRDDGPHRHRRRAKMIAQMARR